MRKFLINNLFTAIILLMLNTVFSVNIFSQSGKAKLTPYAQGDWTVGLGLSIIKVLGDNPAGKYLLDTNYIGGSFGGAQSGIDFRITYTIPSSDFSIPFGFNTYWYLGKERIPYNSNLDFRFSHTLNIFSPYLGVQYYFSKLPLGGAKIYLAGNIEANYINSVDFRTSVLYRDHSKNDTVFILNPKTSTLRIGSDLKIGIIGKLEKNYEINVSAGYNITNMFLKDPKRGELLTPSNLIESKESSLTNFIFSMMIQYRFDL